MHLLLFSDGGSRGNPGPAGCGAVITDERGKVLKKLKKYLGVTTNNQAEYQALIMGLKAAAKFKPASITCYLDSELVVRQLRGEYRIKKPDLKPHVEWIRQFIVSNPNTKFIHIPRHKNALADELANEAMDKM
jgi:ribonuclease HI